MTRAERKAAQQRAAIGAMLEDARKAAARRQHASCCALHDGPALEPGPCDCGAEPGLTPCEYERKRAVPRALLVLDEHGDAWWVTVH